MLYLLTILMGIVEGVTEFIPVSSTGHLILVGDLVGFAKYLGSNGEQVADTFEVFIQLGAILAVVAAYPGRFTGLLNLRQREGFRGIRGLTLLFITSVPAGLLGLAVHKLIKTHLFNSATVAIGLAVGALWILLVERFWRRGGKAGVDSIGPKEALCVGLFQCVSLWPGMSRSTSTILGGMLSGIDRKTATEYSFFAAVPIMCAAVAFDLYKNREFLSTEHIPVFAIGFVVSFIVAWIAVKSFVAFLSRHTLTSFGWYRLAIAAAVCVLAMMGLVKA
jgi:undecaprenyl-diphosphatase